jgi:hypothetical protein
VSEIATFDLSALADAVECPGEPKQYPFLFSPDFQRIAVSKIENGTRYAGWIDYTGHFTPISPAAQDADFGPSTYPAAVGFDKHGNYYYSIGTETNGRTSRTDYFKTPNGPSTQAEQAQLVGSTTPDTVNALGITRVPGGELGLTDRGGLNADLVGTGVQCSDKRTSVDGDYDPDRSVYFFARDKQVFRSSKFCDDEGAVPITPIAKDDLQYVLSDPSASTVVFRMYDKVFEVDANGSSTPHEIDNPASDLVAQGIPYRWQ